jgi:hypothetical protein
MSDAEYFILRAQQELSAAMRSSDLRVRQVHLALADAYSFKVRGNSSVEAPLSGFSRGSAA